MVKKLTKDLVAGIAKRETVTLKDFDGNDYAEVEIRPLSYPEKQKVQSMMNKGMKIKGKQFEFQQQMHNIEQDISKVADGYTNALLEAAAFGLVDETWDKSTIKETWPAHWIEAVGEEVMQLSGMGSDEGDSFQKQDEEDSEE